MPSNAEHRDRAVQRPLQVDGRPAVEWVTSLPFGWTTPLERLLLTLLALDAYGQEPPFTSSPSTDQLVAWTGAYKGRVLEALGSLSEPTKVRPALLAVTRGRGSRRSVYELVGVRSWSGRPGHNDRGLWSGTPDHNQDARGRGDRTTTGGRGGRTTAESLGPALGPALGPDGSRGGPTAPFPFPSPSVLPSSSQPQTARANQEGGGPNRYLDRELRELGVDNEDERRWLITRLLRDPETKDPQARLHTPWLPEMRILFGKEELRRRDRERWNEPECEHGVRGGAPWCTDCERSSRIRRPETSS
jgi:hypothetical protein